MHLHLLEIFVTIIWLCMFIFLYVLTLAAGLPLQFSQRMMQNLLIPFFFFSSPSIKQRKISHSNMVIIMGGRNFMKSSSLRFHKDSKARFKLFVMRRCPRKVFPISDAVCTMKQSFHSDACNDVCKALCTVISCTAVVLYCCTAFATVLYRRAHFVSFFSGENARGGMGMTGSTLRTMKSGGGGGAGA